MSEQTQAPAKDTVKKGNVIGKAPCQQCKEDHHEACPGAFENGAPDRLWICPCPADHQRKRPFCRRCKHETEINPEKWLCIDVSACAARVEKRLAADPLIQSIRSAQAKAEATKLKEREMARGRRAIETDVRAEVEGAVAAHQARRRPAHAPRKSAFTKLEAPRYSECLCCGQPTKGGRFIPGHDARLIGQIIRNTSPATDLAPAKAADWMRKNGCSELLIAKLEKRIANG